MALGLELGSSLMHLMTISLLDNFFCCELLLLLEPKRARKLLFVFTFFIIFLQKLGFVWV